MREAITQHRPRRGTAACRERGLLVDVGRRDVVGDGQPVLDEDRQMCELQQPREVPINPSRGGWGVLVTPGDTPANKFQKQLRRWPLAQSERAAGQSEVS